MPILNDISANAYARHRLQHELAPELRYHSFVHTSNDVLPAAIRLALIAGVNHEDCVLLRTAAWYHDLGFVIQRDDHESVSARLAGEILPSFGYNDDQVAHIQGMILATRLPQTPHTFLEKLIADADLDSLGRTDFLQTSLNLRTELYLYGTPIPTTEWYTRQLNFLTTHRYWTIAACKLRNAGKQQNSKLLRNLIHETSCTLNKPHP